MTPQEELYAEFFRNEKEQIALLTDEELRERIEEWSKIAFEARARLYASKDEQNERRAKKGVKATVQGDELSSNAINNITERSVKMSKREKQIQNLIKIGVDRAAAEAMVPDVEKMSKGKAAVAVDKLKDINGNSSAEKLTDAIMNPPASKPFVNPFAKKEEVPESKTETHVTIIDESTVVIRETVTETKPEEKKELGFKNPFAK